MEREYSVCIITKLPPYEPSPSVSVFISYLGHPLAEHKPDRTIVDRREARFSSALHSHMCDLHMYSMQGRAAASLCLGSDTKKSNVIDRQPYFCDFTCLGDVLIPPLLPTTLRNMAISPPSSDPTWQDRTGLEKVESDQTTNPSFD